MCDVLLSSFSNIQMSNILETFTTGAKDQFCKNCLIVVAGEIKSYKNSAVESADEQ